MSCLLAVAVGCGRSASPPPEAPVTPETATNVDIADDAMPLVDAWAEALGGRDAISRLGTVHVKGDCVIDQRACTFESFVSPAGEVRYAVAYPDGGFAYAFDGTAGWRKEGDAVTDLAGADLESARRASFLDSYSMFYPDRQYGRITRDGAASLAILPRGASTPIVMRFRGDQLPVSGDGTGFRVVYTAWNEYLGVQVPQAWTSGPTGSENTFRVSRIDDDKGTYTKP